MTKRNPKQEGSNVWDCIPQVGPCPNNCNQCFYNRPEAFYVPIDTPLIPTPAEVGNGIVRMNCGHDSNIQRDLVIETAKQYNHFFFNTSIPDFDFPGPVVLTANPDEEKSYVSPWNVLSKTNNLMFVRLRVSSSNLDLIRAAVRDWASVDIPVVLTFMAYYEDDKVPDKENYEWKVRHINSYYCPKESFIMDTLHKMKQIAGRNVTVCGRWCRDCRNCEMYYWRTLKHLQEIG